jgi:hypothetical protein
MAAFRAIVVLVVSIILAETLVFHGASCVIILVCYSFLVNNSSKAMSPSCNKNPQGFLR